MPSRGGVPKAFRAITHALSRLKPGWGVEQPRSRRARREGAARQRLHPAGRACDRRRVGGESARSCLFSEWERCTRHSESRPALALVERALLLTVFASPLPFLFPSPASRRHRRGGASL